MRLDLRTIEFAESQNPAPLYRAGGTTRRPSRAHTKRWRCGFVTTTRRHRRSGLKSARSKAPMKTFGSCLTEFRSISVAVPCGMTMDGLPVAVKHQHNRLVQDVGHKAFGLCSGVCSLLRHGTASETGCLARFCSRSSGFRDRRAPDYATRQIAPSAFARIAIGKTLSPGAGKLPSSDYFSEGLDFAVFYGPTELSGRSKNPWRWGIPPPKAGRVRVITAQIGRNIGHWNLRHGRRRMGEEPEPPDRIPPAAASLNFLDSIQPPPT